MSFITSPGIIVPPLTAGGVAYGTGSQAKVTSAGTTGQALLSAGSGVPTFGVPTGAISPPYTAGAVAYGTGTGITLSAAGTVGQVLTSNGAGVPTFNTLAGGGVTSFSGASTGLTPATATTGAVSLAGTLAVGSGGTSLTTLTANNVILGNGTSAPGFVAPGTNGNVLTSNGTTWSSTSPTMFFVGQTTLSGSSTVITLDNSTYSSYLFLGSNIGTTAAASNVDFYIRANGVSSASYSSSGYATANGTPQGYNSSTNTSDTFMTPHKPGYNFAGVSGGTSYRSSMMLRVFNVKSIGQTANSQTSFMCSWLNSGGNQSSVGVAGFSSAGITSITFSWASGSTMNGTVQVYGIV